MGEMADDYIQRMIERCPRLPLRERNATACKLCSSTRATADGFEDEPT